jgi:hypothetical protein
MRNGQLSHSLARHNRKAGQKISCGNLMWAAGKGRALLNPSEHVYCLDVNFVCFLSFICVYPWALSKWSSNLIPATRFQPLEFSQMTTKSVKSPLLPHFFRSLPTHPQLILLHPACLESVVLLARRPTLTSPAHASRSNEVVGRSYKIPALSHVLFKHEYL